MLRSIQRILGALACVEATFRLCGVDYESGLDAAVARLGR